MRKLTLTAAASILAALALSPAYADPLPSEASTTPTASAHEQHGSVNPPGSGNETNQDTLVTTGSPAQSYHGSGPDVRTPNQDVWREPATPTTNASGDAQ